MVTERVILSYQKNFDVFIVRPATVCGFSSRMRLDVAVNALTFSALNNKVINVHGGQQIRPNIHIDDMCGLYEFFIKTNKKNAGIYNAGFENLSIINIAKKITKEDLYNALEKYKENDEVKNRDENESLKNYVLNTMYC